MQRTGVPSVVAGRLLAMTRKVATGDGIIEIGAPNKLPEQVEFVYGTAAEAQGRINELEEQVDLLRDLLIQLGGPAYAEALERYTNP